LEFLNQPVSQFEDIYAAIEKKKQIYRNLSFCSVPVPKKEIEKWAECTSKFIIGDGDRDLEIITDRIWVVRGDTAGKIYRNIIGFVPIDIADLLDEVT
jgi:hypothetical protein